MNEVLTKIEQLIPQAPADWANQIAQKMGKSIDSVYAYSHGIRGVRKGHPKEVLRLLIELVQKENEDTQKLIQ